MKTTDIIIAIKDAWENYSKINAFCEEEGLPEPTIFIGLDLDELPGAGDFPVMILQGLSEIKENARAKEFACDIAVGVVNDEVRTVGRVRELMGFSQVERFRALAEEAIIKAHLGRVGFTGETEQVSLFPMFVSMSTVTIEVPVTRARM